jgi:hypothetical protein
MFLVFVKSLVLFVNGLAPYNPKGFVAYKVDFISD